MGVFAYRPDGTDPALPSNAVVLGRLSQIEWRLPRYLATSKPNPSVSIMMTLEWMSGLARYNRWMNDRLYELASTFSDEARKRDDGAFFQSIHGTLNHLLLADRVWLARFKGTTVADGFMGSEGIRSLDQELYAEFEELRRERARTDDELSTWVSALTNERLNAPLAYMRRGVKQESPLWWAVAHLFNHQTHHRGQITTLLKQQGSDPGITDLFAMLRAEQLGTR